MFRKSITWRLTLLFSVLSSTVLASVAIIASVALEKHFEEEDLGEINGKLELIKYAFEKTQTTDDLKMLPQKLNDALIGHHALMVSVYQSDKTQIFASPHIAFPDKLLDSPIDNTSNASISLTKWQQGSDSYRGMVIMLPVGVRDMSPMKVAIGLNIDHHEKFISGVHNILLVALLAGILLMVAAGWLAARRGLAPVREFDQLTKRVSASQLHDRLNIDNVPEELRELAQSFNAMLSRLEDSFARLSDFSSDIAHELRTPISNLMTQSHVALSQPRSVESYQEVLYSCLEEYERLSSMIGDMLFLAKADNGLIVPHRESIDLGTEADAVIEFYEPLATDKSINILRTGTASMMGDRIMLRRALSNLLSNAIRHTPKGRAIKIDIETLASGHTRLSMENPGEPIATEHLSRIFDRFYRIDSSRHRSSEGAGLGLAITKSIIEAHGGKISVASNESKIIFEVLIEPILS